MSIALMSRVFDESETRRNDRLVLLILCDSANDAGEASWPSHQRIAKRAKVSISTARISLECLRRVGVITWGARFTSSGRQTSNGYTVIASKFGQDAISNELRETVRAEIKGLRKGQPAPQGATRSLPPKGIGQPAPQGAAHPTPKGATTHTRTHPVDSPKDSAAGAAVIFATVLKEYSNNVGLPTPIIRDELQRAYDLYGGEWVMLAIEEAVLNSARSWRYIETCLKNWKANGLKHRAERDGRRNSRRPVSSPPAAPSLHSKFSARQMNQLYKANMTAQQMSHISAAGLSFEAAFDYVTGVSNGGAID